MRGGSWGGGGWVDIAIRLKASEYTQRNLFEIQLKSDCIYHAPIDLEQQTDTVRLLFQINWCMVNTI